MLVTDATPTPIVYRIVVGGFLDDGWAQWFADLAISHGQDASGATVTILAGPLADQATLYGVLARLADLNVTLLSVSCSGAAVATTDAQEVTKQ